MFSISACMLCRVNIFKQIRHDLSHNFTNSGPLKDEVRIGRRKLKMTTMK